MKAGRWILFTSCTLAALAVGILLPDLVFRSQEERLYGQAVSYETDRLRFRTASQLTDRLRLADSSYTRVNLDSGTYHDAREIWENARLAAADIAESRLMIPGFSVDQYTNHRETAFLAIAGSDMKDGSEIWDTGETEKQEPDAEADTDIRPEDNPAWDFNLKIREEGSDFVDSQTDRSEVRYTDQFEIRYYNGTENLGKLRKPSTVKEESALPEEDVATAVFWECRMWDEDGNVLILIMDDDSGKMVSFERQTVTETLFREGFIAEDYDYGYKLVYQPYTAAEFCIEYYGLEAVRTVYVVEGEDNTLFISLDASDSYGSRIFFTFEMKRNGFCRFNDARIVFP